jgi:hypothetical protein
LALARSKKEKAAREQAMERAALCHCGSLRVIAFGEPDRVYVCHCAACQRRTGAIMHSGAAYLKSQVRIEGASKVYARNADSGYEIRFHFCPNCGSNVYWEGERFPDEYGIAVGSFADPDFASPTYSVYEESMHHWVRLPSGINHFAKGRPLASR